MPSTKTWDLALVAEYLLRHTDVTHAHLEMNRVKIDRDGESGIVKL